jgi:hypothetical protein
MDSGHETIQLRLENRTAWITLDRPPLNILDIPMTQALDTALEQVLPNCDFVRVPKDSLPGRKLPIMLPSASRKCSRPFTLCFAGSPPRNA